MTAALTPRGRGLLALVALAVAGATLARSAAPVVLAAPAAAALAAGLVAARPPRITLAARLAPARVAEGEPTTVTLRLAADVALPVVRCTPAVGAPADALPATVSLRPGVPETVAIAVRPRRWGVHDVGTVAVEARDALGMLAWRGRRKEELVVRVQPVLGRVRAAVPPGATGAAMGAHVSRARGEGIEFAEVRELRPGDRGRSLNPRVTARRGRPFVNERHPERSADVVVFVDTFRGAGPARGGTLDVSLRAAAVVAGHHLAQRDRVGLVRFGGIVSWIAPAQGARQRERIADALLRTEVVDTYLPGHVGALPNRAMPPRALVVAFSPLVDERAFAALVALRRREVDLVVVEVDARPWAPEPRRAVDELALRLWRLAHEARRARLRELGVPVALLRQGGAVESALAELAAWRRGRRHGAVRA